MPLTATIAAVAQQRAPRRRARRPRVDVRRRRIDEPQRGPQSGQAFGWAWKRRSSGSSYSARQRVAHREAGHRRQRPVVGHAAHDREPRAAVRAVDERVADSGGRPGRTARPGSRRRSRVSGATERVRRAARARSARSRSPRSPRRRELLDRRTPSTRASGGASRGQPLEEARRPRRPAPSTSTSTPRSSLSTKPGEAAARAPAGSTYGRKPTPCTVALDPRAATPRGRTPRHLVLRPRAASRRGRTRRAGGRPASAARSTGRGCLRAA